jgi:hypothetical protein
MFRSRPELAAEIVDRSLGISLPRYREALLRSETVTDDRLAELKADAVVEYRQAKRRFAVIVEVQNAPDKDKSYAWPFYLMGARYRLRCPVKLLVICLSRRAAAWAAQTIDCEHPGMTLTPIVFGPDQIPQVVTPEEATRVPELAVLSALAHGGGQDGEKTLASLVDAYGVLDDDHRALYHDVVSAVLPQAAQHYLETLMKLKNYEYQSDFARHYFSKGKAEGRAEGKAQGEVESAAKIILRVLAARGVCVSPEARARITGCGDLAQLEAWAERAAVVSTTAELFD